MPLNPSDQLDWTSDLTSSHQELQEGFQSPKPKVGEVDVPKKKCSTKSQREIGGIKSWMGGTNLIDFVVEHMLKSSLVYCLRNVMNLWTLSQTSFGNQRGGDMENQRLCVCRSGSFIRFYHWFVLVPFQGLVLFRSICLTFFFFEILVHQPIWLCWFKIIGDMAIHGCPHPHPSQERTVLPSKLSAGTSEGPRGADLTFITTFGKLGIRTRFFWGGRKDAQKKTTYSNYSTLFLLILVWLSLII